LSTADYVHGCLIGDRCTFGGMAVAIAWLHGARPRMTLDQWLPGMRKTGIR